MGRSKEAIKKNNEIVKRIYRNYLIRIRKDDEAIISKLNSVDSINGYIVDLIRKDLKKTK